jgi:glycerate kinase
MRDCDIWIKFSEGLEAFTGGNQGAGAAGGMGCGMVAFFGSLFRWE